MKNNFRSRNFDIRMGLISALVMASIVYTINMDHGVTSALIAASKQGTYTFIAAGFITKLTENMSVLTKHWVSYVYAIGLSTFIALTLTFLIHSLKGTPEPLNSTIPTLILAPPGFFWLSYRKRKELPIS